MVNPWQQEAERSQKGFWRRLFGGQEGIVVVLVTRYPGETEPVKFEVAEGEAGIPVFDTVEDAEEFAEAYRELLGPGLEALELPDRAMRQLLEDHADETEYVILKPRPDFPRIYLLGDSVNRGAARGFSSPL